MKKSLVLAMAMALGVTASAYAANPFSDVPAGHWAYDSVSKLAAAGIVQGYGDTTFGGDKLMTRYEMAEIVAKALAKGANVDKLAAEFADELNALGVRVAKLEKKADNVKIAGTVKYQIKSFHRESQVKASWDKEKSAIKYGSNNNFSRLRSDITLKGAVNEDWTYTALVRNEQRLDKGGKNKGEETARFQRAYVNGKIGGLKVQAGRYNWTSPAGGDIWDDRVDGVQVSYGKDIKLTGGYMQAANAWGAETKVAGDDKSNYIYFANVDAKLGKAIKANVAYVNFEDLDDEVWTAGLSMNLSKSLALGAQYFHADQDGLKADKDGWTATLSYKGAKAAKAGSFGLMAKYYDMPVAAAVAPGFTYDCAQPVYYIPNAKNDGVKTVKDGVKGFQVRAEYAFAKGIVGKVAYYDLKGQNKAEHQETLMTEVVFSF